MSISENVGALSPYFARVLSGPLYTALREGSKKVLRRCHRVGARARSEEHVKGMVLPGTLFEEFGFNYIGPIDGHDMPRWWHAAQPARAEGPAVPARRHAKGKGYAPAEADPIKWHGPGPFDPTSGTIFKEKSTGPDLFAGVRRLAVRHGRARPALVGITPAMREGSGLVEFSKRFPDRYFDVAIAEQHAVTLRRRLACEG
jgi:1-deoxy-D-xylulose-5-phosphate synthase